MYLIRLKKLQEVMLSEKLEIVAINAGVDLKYFTGLDFHISERPAVLLIPSEGQPAFIFPEFEIEKARQSSQELALFPYPEDTNTWPAVFLQAAKYFELSKKTIGVSPESMRYLELEMLKQAAGHGRFISAMEIFKSLKIRKDKDEIFAIRKAISIAEKALMNLLPQIQPGISEKWLANQLVINLLTEGSDADLPFNPIIASGPNSANPHSVPGDRVLENGDILLIDWGARSGGYLSDLTRSFFIGSPDSEMSRIARIVLEANQTARKAAKTGIPASDLDKAARDVITKAGYGDAFTHRTGHGFGLLPHEDPYISQFNSALLENGMVFTIEPGIYLPGKGGIRIEDNILVNGDICETISDFPREVKVMAPA